MPVDQRVGSTKAVYRLSATQWRDLERLAKEHPRAGNILLAGTARALIKRGLVVPVESGRGPFGLSGHALTELGQRVYARLSAGCFCRVCGKPLTFCRRVASQYGGVECESHANERGAA